MDELNSEETQVLPQIIEQPRAVWFFGVINIALGCYQLINFYNVSFKIITTYKGPATIGALSYLLLISIISVGLPLWLIILGMGLLKMKTWARRGSCMYARLRIMLTVITMVFFVTSLIVNRASFPMDKLVPYIIVMLIGLMETFIYPLLLLIFMKTEKVKHAFAGIGG